MRSEKFSKMVAILLLVWSPVLWAEGECVPDGLYQKMQDVLGRSVILFKAGRHVETEVLGRKMLKLKSDLKPGKPDFVDSSVNDSIRFRIENGETNLDLMKNGNAPIGKDGKQINLHHLFGEEPGPMAELEAGLHQIYHKELHAMITESFRRDDALSSAYDRFRKAYWKLRANDF